MPRAPAVRPERVCQSHPVSVSSHPTGAGESTLPPAHVLERRNQMCLAQALAGGHTFHFSLSEAYGAVSLLVTVRVWGVPSTSILLRTDPFPNGNFCYSTVIPIPSSPVPGTHSSTFYLYQLDYPRNHRWLNSHSMCSVHWLASLGRVRRFISFPLCLRLNSTALCVTARVVSPFTHQQILGLLPPLTTISSAAENTRAQILVLGLAFISVGCRPRNTVIGSLGNHV